MKEFTKVSVHNHFGGNDADRLVNEPYNKQVTFNYQMAYEKIKEASEYGYKLLSMTQANVFDVSSYILVRKFANSLGIEMLPGVELNVKNTKERYLHIVINFDPKNNLFDIQNTIDEYIKSNKENSLEVNQFLDLIVAHKCIIIPHGTKQNKRSSANNPEILTELISLADSIPVVLEDNKKYHKEVLKSKIKDILNQKDYEWIEKSAVITAADRMDFSQIGVPTYIWGAATFNDLYYSCFMGESRIKHENDLVQKINYISKIEISSSEKTQISPTTILCSHGLNTIIGPSGSGKTLLLDIIKRKLTGMSLDHKTISKDSDYSSIYSLDDIDIYDREGQLIDTTTGYSIVEGEILYNKVISAYKSDKKTMLKELKIEIENEGIQEIVDNFNSKINQYKNNCLSIKKNKEEISALLNNVASTMLFLNENKSNEIDVINYQKDETIKSKLATHSARNEELLYDISQINKKVKELIAIASKHGFENKFKEDLDYPIKKFTSTLYKMQKTTNTNLLNLKIVDIIQTNIYSIVQEYNKKIGQQSALVIERKQELLTKFERIRNLLYKNILLRKKLIVPSIDKSEIKNSIKLFSGNYAKLNINSINLEFDVEKLRDYCSSNIGNSPKVNKSKFRLKSYDFTDIGNVKSFIDTFVEHDYDNHIVFTPNYNELIDYNILLLNIEGNYEDINNISAGNLSKIYINRMFSDKIESAGSNVIILYDQPDSNMEKAFILQELGPRLSDLRDKYQVFITTHEPLLVVNADSNNIVEANNSKTAIKLNDISYVNKSFAGANSKSSLVLEVAKLIDGHPDAISRRNTIYGGLLNED